jgi:hypothetical protein
MKNENTKRSQSVLPLLVQFKKKLSPHKLKHRYDKERDLHVTKRHGKDLPTITIPGNLALLKTQAIVAED